MPTGEDWPSDASSGPQVPGSTAGNDGRSGMGGSGMGSGSGIGSGNGDGDGGGGGGGNGGEHSQKATVLWDHQDCLPVDKIPTKAKPILLLTPVVAPPIDQDPSDTRDPFEILGQTLAGRDIAIRHVPYTQSRGITGIHVAFIRRARAVIFVITGFPDSGELSQPELAELVGRICESQPLIIVACCELTNERLPNAYFGTVIQTTGYSSSEIQAVVALLLDGHPVLVDPRPDVRGVVTDHGWSVQAWDMERDLVETYGLWVACLPRKFHASMTTLRSLLRRDGYALHYAVREPSRKALVGFCATYITFADSSGNELIGSIAVILVREQFRGQGIGVKLHDAATGRLRSIRGIKWVQLGTTFPRLLHGIPLEAPATRWFERRGWSVDRSGPGKGRLAADWVLRFSNWPRIELASAGLSFGQCDESVAQRVLDMVRSQGSMRNPCFGWYDQYARAMNSGHIGDIMVGFEGTTIVATAITYYPGHDGPAAADIPWPAVVGSDTGGVTCICIKEDDPEMVSRRDTVMVRLLHACRKTLGERGMTGMFLDAIRLGEHGLGSLGFQKWADYQEIWKPAQNEDA